MSAAPSALAALVHACLMLGRVRRDDSRAARRLTAAAVAFSTSCALLIAGALAFVDDSPLGGSWRVVGILLVLAVLCTLLAPLVRRLGRATDSRAGHRSVGASC
jgi:hypothetical protein